MKFPLNLQLTGGASQMGTRIQYTTRQEGPPERHTIYRAIAPTGTKRTPPATPVQRVGVRHFCDRFTTISVEPFL